MKYLMTLILAFSLAACSSEEITDVNTSSETPNIIDAREAGANTINPDDMGRLGDICGPSSTTVCASGLSCQFEGLQQDAGKCLPVVVNPDLECDNTQAPVCGLIGNNKNGYLNKCFAERFGAIVVNEGFCKPDETITNNCEARAYSLGNCQNTFTGAFFNQETGECEAVNLVGCSADMPFETIDTCQARCS